MLNRTSIFACIQTQMESAGANGRIAVLVLRMHGLRETCLRLGYEAADEVERAAGELIRECLRPADQVLSGGEGMFIVVLAGVRGATHAQLAAVRLASAFDMSQTQVARPWHGRMTMGVALYPEHASNPEDLCRLSEIAHDEAQRSGQLFAVYAPHQMGVEILYDELREAIKNNRLDVHFQAVWDVASGRMVGVESLARWTSARHGPVSPADFVTFAEHHGLIDALSRWSVNTTLRHASRLSARDAMTFAVNLSPRLFGVPGLVEQLLGALEIWSVPPQSLCIEVTETAAIHDLEASVQVLRRLRDHGVGVAIDDFGTGYASFSYLQRFPATELKIDMSLVQAMRTDGRTAKMVRAMVDVAHHLDMRAIAEGIEDAETLHMLADMGCDMAQGYYLGRPEPAKAFVDAQLAGGSDTPVVANKTAGSGA